MTYFNFCACVKACPRWLHAHLRHSSSPFTFTAYDVNIHAKCRRKALSTALGALHSTRSPLRVLHRHKGKTTTQKGKHCDVHTLLLVSFFFFFSVTSLPGFPLATRKSSRPSSAEHVASIRASTFAVSVSVGRSSLVSSLVRATLRVLR